MAGKLCFGMSAGAITAWLRDFAEVYRSATGRFPLIFLSASWWAQCAGDDPSFGDELPLWLANWSTSMGSLPTGWTEATFWQYSGLSLNSGEADVFFGDRADLVRFALGE